MNRLASIFGLTLMCWALFPTGAAVADDGPPGTVAAVQERGYRMQHEFGFAAGLLPQDPFTKGLYGQFTYAFHFTDALGWQARGAYVLPLRSDLRLQLERDFGVLPNAFEQVLFFAGSDLLWKPLYGKVAAINRWLIHGEAFLLVGGNLFRFTNDTGFPLRVAVNLGGGFRLFLTKRVGLRFDLTDNVVIPIGGKRLGSVITMSLSLTFNLGATE